MKILMLNYEYPPIGGGTANATKYILKEFSKMRGIDVDLITSSQNQFIVKALSSNITAYRLGIHKKNLHFWTQREILSYCIKAFKQIKKMKKEKKYDLIHAFFGIPCGAIAYLFRKEIPYIVSLRGSDVPGFNQRFSTQYIFLKPIIKHIWRSSSAIIANSQGLKNLALKTDKDADIEIILNGVDIEEFSPRRRFEKKEIHIILTVARLINRKGIDDLIRAVPKIVKKYKNIKVRIIGEGIRENKLKDLAQQLKVSNYIDFLGYIPHHEISNHYSSSDIFVLPSKNEGMSNSILEAMASGMPIITTNTGGVQELIHKNGIIIPIGNSEAISNAVLKLISDHKLMKSMSVKSREIAKNLRWKNVAEKYIELYKSLI